MLVKEECSDERIPADERSRVDRIGDVRSREDEVMRSLPDSLDVQLCRGSRVGFWEGRLCRSSQLRREPHERKRTRPSMALMLEPLQASR
jgi:hypothetical protein